MKFSKLDLCFSGGLVLTSATQLRIPGSPLGPGELFLCIWLACVSVPALYRGWIRVDSLFRGVLAFWALSFVLLLAGWQVAAHLRHEVEGVLTHDLLAFFLCALVVLAYASLPDREMRALRAADLLPHIAITALIVVLVVSLVAPGVVPLRYWRGFRFQGWAKNPNQLALLLCPIPFLCLRSMAIGRTLPLKLYSLLALIGCITLGILTRSDALSVAWLGGLLFLGGLYWLTELRTSRSVVRTAVLALVIPLGLLTVAVRFGSTLERYVVESSESTYKSNDQGSDRLTLWKYGMQAVAVSPVVGLGPGAHSGRSGPFQAEEAHNTLVDWATCTGVLGLISYLALAAWLLIRTLRGASPIATAVVCSLLFFSVFHFVLRHPIFWFYMVTMVVIAEEADGRSAPSRRKEGRSAVRPAPAAETLIQSGSH